MNCFLQNFSLMTKSLLPNNKKRIQVVGGNALYCKLMGGATISCIFTGCFYCCLFCMAITSPTSDWLICVVLLCFSFWKMMGKSVFVLWFLVLNFEVKEQIFLWDTYHIKESFDVRILIFEFQDHCWFLNYIRNELGRNLCQYRIIMMKCECCFTL